MKIKKLILLILALSLIMMQTGCSSRNELGNLSVATGFLLEPQEKGFLLIADCADFSGQNSNEGANTKQITVTASNLKEAFDSLKAESELSLSCSRAKVLLLGNGFSDNRKKAIVAELFDTKAVPPDISVLEANFSSKQLRSYDNPGFSPTVSRQLEKEKNTKSCRLYQLINQQKNYSEIPVVTLSENGFYLQN